MDRGEDQRSDTEGSQLRPKRPDSLASALRLAAGSEANQELDVRDVPVAEDEFTVEKVSSLDDESLLADGAGDENSSSTRVGASSADDNHPIEAPSDARVDVDQPVAGPRALSDDEAASETSNSTDRSVEDIGTTDSVDAGDVDSIASEETDVEDGINDKGEPAGPALGDTAVDAVENEVAAADTDISADGTPGEDGCQRGTGIKRQCGGRRASRS